MKRKGFTLIELLAVIVILAIIALIATPAVLNIIEDSRKGAAEASARNIVSAAKTYYMSETMNGRTPSSIDLSADTLKYDGDQASKGTILFTNGKATSKMYINGYCVEVKEDGKVTSEKKTEDECVIEVTPVTYTKYADGTPLLYDPVNNVKCDTINGDCMKWYAFLDSEDSSTVKLLLDHNTTSQSYWNLDENGSTPDFANEQLQEDSKNWETTVKNSVRLISGEEVVKITQNNDNWVQTDSNTWYYFHTGNQTQYKGTAGSNTYAWLFDNLGSCEVYGCNSNKVGTSGYWTSSLSKTGFAWAVFKSGSISIDSIDTDILSGVRPVITVNKSIFK